jgi:hypothetical protein
MLPFPSPNETMNRTLEGTEQQQLEDDALDAQDRPDDLPATDRGGAETQKASDETLDKPKE